MINGEGPKSLRQMIFEKKKCRVMFQNVGSKRLTATLLRNFFFVMRHSHQSLYSFQQSDFGYLLRFLSSSADSVFFKKGR